MEAGGISCRQTRAGPVGSKWVEGKKRRTIALSLLPLAFDVVFPELGDGRHNFLLRVAFVPEVVVVGVALRDALGTTSSAIGLLRAFIVAEQERTYENFLSHEATQLPGAVDWVPFAQHELQIVRWGCVGRALRLATVEDELRVEIMLYEV